MKPLAEMRERMYGHIVHETLVMDSGLVVSYDMVGGVRVGHHRTVPQEQLGDVVSKLQRIAHGDAELVTD